MRNAFWGLALLLVGGLLLASNLGYIAPFSLWDLWPILIIWPALKVVFGRVFVSIFEHGPASGARIRLNRSLGVRLVALWLLAGATAQLLHNLDLLAYDWGDVSYWTLPVLLVGIGLAILLRPQRRRPSFTWYHGDRNHAGCGGSGTTGRDASGGEWTEWDEPEGSRSFVSVGDLRYGARPWEFKSPMLVNMWAGDVDMDLTTARFAEADNYLTVTGWAGDVDIRTPDDLEVIVEARSSAGDIHVFDQHRDGVSPHVQARRRPRALAGAGGDEASNGVETAPTRRLFIGVEITFGSIRVR